MTVILSVSEVRRELYRAAGRKSATGDGQPTTMQLGRLFHQIFAELLGQNPERNVKAVLADADRDPESWQAALIEHVYRHLVGPQLAEHRAILQAAAGETLSFWEAVKAACGWIADLSRAAESGPHASVRTWTLPDLIDAEQELSWEIQEPEWTDSVQLQGIADVILRLPMPAPWCVVELKLGRTVPEVDLAQACLYYEMLSASRQEAVGESEGTLAVLSFLPEPEEKLFNAQELAQVRSRLKNLIGRLAGVLPEEKKTISPTTGKQPSVTPIDKPDRETGKKSRNRKPSQEQIDQGKQLVATFREYNAPLELDGEPIVGPTFLRYPVALGRGVKVAAVKSRVDEVQMRLKLAEPPIINLSGGQVTIDVQRPDRQYVTFSEIEDRLPTPDPLSGCSQVPIGIDLDDELQFANLGQPEHCHLLVAGTTGSGKSEWLRSMLAGLLRTNTPETLRLVLIDPKRNAFHQLKDSPFLWQPIVFPDEQPVAEILTALADEMDLRYAAMEGADTIEHHVRRTGQPVPRIVCVCDEYFDLIQRSREERKAIEGQLFRLGAKARAAGIHLIIATQQPSREVIKGALDANMPARVGLKTNNGIESSMLLGRSGAENLLGNGDLLFKAIGDPSACSRLFCRKNSAKRFTMAKQAADNDRSQRFLDDYAHRRFSVQFLVTDCQPGHVVPILFCECVLQHEWKPE